MRKQKTIKIDDREITVREITVKEIRDFWQDFETVPVMDMENIFAVLERFMPTCILGMASSDLDNMTPSEAKQIYDTFTEVNDVFFSVARLIQGENPILVGLRQALVPLLLMRFAGFFRLDTQESLTTDTDSLSEQPES